MSLLESGVSAVSRLAILALLSGAFLFGMAGVVYMSLQGDEITVPEITGKDLSDGEHELAQLGLKIKKRASRFSSESPNTVIEQLPKPGEMVKTGQLILVVTSKGPGDGDQPTSLKNVSEEDDSEKIEEMISDKPKKPKANSNTNRKKADTTRDVEGDGSEKDAKSDSSDSGSNKKDAGTGSNSIEKTNKNTQAPGSNRSPVPSSNKPSTGDSRPKPQQQP